MRFSPFVLAKAGNCAEAAYAVAATGAALAMRDLASTALNIYVTNLLPVTAGKDHYVTNLFPVTPTAYPYGSRSMTLSASCVIRSKWLSMRKSVHL